MKYEIASLPLSIILKIFKMLGNYDIVAMASPFSMQVITLKGMELNERILKHEYRHLEQIRYEGRIKFILKYLFWLIVKGYTNNPYEIDARKHEI